MAHAASLAPSSPRGPLGIIYLCLRMFLRVFFFFLSLSEQLIPYK